MNPFFKTTFFLLLCCASFTVRAADNKIWQNAVDKQTLRCGYITYEPGFIKNVNTNSFSGYDKDVIQAVADRLELKIEWVPASGWGTFVDDLHTGKFDMLCNLTWTNAKHSKHVLYAQPAFYQPLFFIARKGDTRFNDTHKAVDKAKTKVAVLESDIPYFIMKKDYPKAQLHALPPSADFSLLFNEVATNKADLTIAAASDFSYYDKNNPNKLRLVDTDHPVRVFPSAFVIPSGETQMKQAVDQALSEMILSGEMKAIFKKYATTPYSFYYPTIAFETK